MTGASITAEALIAALTARGLVTPATLISLMGHRRHQPSLNVIELALIRENILSQPDLLAIKGELSGLPVLSDPSVKVSNYLSLEVARAAGALVLARPAPTVAFIEDTPEAVALVSAAIGGIDFERWLITAPGFAELLRVAYADADADERPVAQDIFAVLDASIEQRASDVHLKVGVPPSLRVDGSMLHLPFQPLTQGWIRDQFEAMASPRHLADMAAKHSTDLAYTFGTSRYRVNAAQDAHGYTMMLRKLPSKIPTFAELGAPEAIRAFAHLERGLVLVTGPTGSGKSTTLAAMLNEVITTSARHVITLEDPIEFRFPTDKSSLVNQRELGESFVSFEGALRDALRQDPDVILVGEMRDVATVKAALTAAETGHLVFGTLHSINAAQTIARVVNSFGADEQDAVRAQLSMMLKGVISQCLLPRAGVSGRVAAYEIMVSNPAIATNLRRLDGANQIKQTMQTSVKEGMATIEMALALLVHRGVVSKDEAVFRAQEVDEFSRQLAYLGTKH